MQNPSSNSRRSPSSISSRTTARSALGAPPSCRFGTYSADAKLADAFDARLSEMQCRQWQASQWRQPLTNAPPALATANQLFMVAWSARNSEEAALGVAAKHYANAIELAATQYVVDPAPRRAAQRFTAFVTLHGSLGSPAIHGGVARTLMLAAALASVRDEPTLDALLPVPTRE